MPLWSRIYSAANSVAAMTAATIDHALKQREVVRSMRSIEEKEQQREVFRFEDVIDDAPLSLDDGSDDDSVDSSASISDHLHRGARRVFRAKSLRPKQLVAIKRIITDQQTDGKLLVVDRTGGGKSLILYMTAISVGGITLVIVPLLSLTANQLERIRQAVQKYGMVSAFNVDDISKSEMETKLIPQIEQFKYNSSSTMLLLSSPQGITDNLKLRNALLRARDREVLRLVAIDEAHLYAMGMTYRLSIRQLERYFFAPIFKRKRNFVPLLLAMTATMPVPLISVLKDLTHVDWMQPRHQMRSTPTEFRQRYIDMQLHVSSEVGTLGLAPIVQLIADDEHKNVHCCLFVNFKDECSKWSTELESRFVDAGIDVDVLQINGDMDKHEKFAFIRLFTSSVKLARFNPNVLVATPAANTGFDQVLVCWVLTLGLPRSMTDLLQERGRNRGAGTYSVMTDWAKFVRLLLSIVLRTQSVAAPADHEYVNTMIESKSPERRPEVSSVVDTSSTLPGVPLTPAQLQASTAQSYLNLIEVINFLFLPDLGCVHLRAEWYLHKGSLDNMPCDLQCNNDSTCENNCFVCNGAYKKYILPVVFEGAVEFLDSDYFLGRHNMPYPLTHETTHDMTNKLWESNDWRTKVFGLKSVKKYNVHSFFFQLIGAGILTFKWANNKSEVTCVLAKDKKGLLKHKSVNSWKGFYFRRRGHGGRILTHANLIELLSK